MENVQTEAMQEWPFQKHVQSRDIKHEILFGDINKGALFRCLWNNLYTG